MSPVAEALAGRHLVVTGATGFVGTVWLSMVLTHAPDVGRITLLARGRRGRSAAERLAERIDTSPAFRPLRDAVDGDLGAWLDARLTVLDADITRPGLGLDPDTYASLCDADAVVHIAGLTDFHPDPRQGMPANVDGAVHLGELAARLPSRRMLHVSTAYVAGTADGPVAERLVLGRSPSGVRFDPAAVWADLRRIAEADTSAADRTDAAGALAASLGWPNNYTFTKGLAEHLLADLDLDLSIVRPSVVECARSFPFAGWNEGLNTSGPILWYCGSGFRALPSTAHHIFDIVPVDAVCRWMTVALAAQLSSRTEPVLHLASGDINPATFDRIVELTALARRRHGRADDGALWDRVAAHIDVVPRRRDAQPVITPERMARWADRLDGRLQRVLHHDATPTPVARRLKRWRREVTRTRRDLSRLDRMLDVYRPFIHDHSWVFATDAIRELVAALPAADPFHDDLRDLCWRRYWIDVQYPGIQRWAFPILTGDPVPTDPPSSPPLTLGPSVDDARTRGVA